MSDIVQIDLDSLDVDLRKKIGRQSQLTGKSREEVIVEILNRKAWVREFERLREKLIPKAEAQGIRTDEDVFRIVS